MKIAKARELEFQPEDSGGMLMFTHFDCWRDSLYRTLWEPDSAKAVNLVWQLMVEAFELTKNPAYLKLGSQYLKLGQVQFFDVFAKRLVRDGFHVYNSDEYFEVYDTDTELDNHENTE